VYRIVQEALTNTMKHASATSARVMIIYDPPVVVINVTDDGTGSTANGRLATLANGKKFDSIEDPGHGIAGMSERAAIHRGLLQAGPTEGGGWTVRATLRPDASLTTQ
jgi:signal transduction histidine kinase